MPNHDPDQEQPVEQKADQALVQKGEALQERLRKMGSSRQIRSLPSCGRATPPNPDLLHQFILPAAKAA